MFLFYIFILHMYGILAWRKYEWAFLLLVASLPLYQIRFDLLGIPFTLLEGMFWVVFGFFAVRKWKEIFNKDNPSQSLLPKRGEALHSYLRKRKKYPFTLGIILFAVSSFVALAMAGFSDTALGVYKAYFIEAILFFVLVFDYLKKVYSPLEGSTAKRGRVLHSDTLSQTTSPASGEAPPSKGEFQLYRTEDSLIISLAVSALLVSLIAVWQKLSGAYWLGGAGELRVTGPFPYPNALALYLGPIIVLLFFYLLSVILERRRSEAIGSRGQSAKHEMLSLHSAIAPFRSSMTMILTSSLFISFLALVFSKSEAGIGAVLMSIFIGSLFINKKTAFGLIGLAVIGFGVVFSFPRFKQEFLWQEQLNTFSGEVRKQQWRETWQMLKDDYNWLTGCGLSGYQKCIEPYHQEGIFFNTERDTDFRRKIVIWDEKYKAEHWRPVEIYMYPHNFFLNFWVELGLLGLIAVIILLFQYFKIGIWILFGNWKLEIGNSAQAPGAQNRILIIGLIATMIEIIIHGAVDVPYFKNDLSFLWWMLFAIMGVFVVEYKIKNRELSKDK